MAGKRPALTSELIDSLVAAMDFPMTLEDACRFVGLAPRTVSRWLSEVDDADDDAVVDPMKLELSQKVAAAQNAGKRGEIMNLLYVQALADPKSTQFLAERLLPSLQVQKKVAVEATVTPKPAKLDFSKLTDDELAALQAAELIKARLVSGD